MDFKARFFHNLLRFLMQSRMVMCKAESMERMASMVYNSWTMLGILSKMVRETQIR